MIKNKKIFYGIFILTILVGAISILFSARLPQENQKPLSTSTSKDKWGPTQNGLKTRLVPLQQKYFIGQPMLFRLEMTNVGNTTIMYDSQQVAVNNSLKITGPDEVTCPYIGGSCQTLGYHKPIKPGETVILFDKFDITSQYFIDKPGKYKVQFRGQSRAFGEVPIPESNVLEIDVHPGSLTLPYFIANRLLEIFPEEWNLVLQASTKTKVNPFGRAPTRGICIFFHLPTEGKDNRIFVGIWLTEHIVDISPQHSRHLEPPYISKYLGKNKWGYVYVTISPEAEKLLPDIKEQLIKALEISDKQ